MKPVHCRIHRSTTAERVRGNDATVVADGHLIGGEVGHRDVCVSDREMHVVMASAPEAVACIPAVEIRRDRHPVADRPVRLRSEVQLVRAEPVPTADDRG